MSQNMADSSTLITTMRRLWSSELDAPADAVWVLFENGTMVVRRDAQMATLTTRQLTSRLKAILSSAERIPGTPSGDLQIVGPDSRWADQQVFFMLFGEGLEGIMVMHVISHANNMTETEEERIRVSLLPILLQRFEQDCQKLHVIDSSKAAVSA
jgi:hypothetical protein